MRYFYLLLISFYLLFLGEAANKQGVYIVYMGASSSSQGAPRADHAHLLNDLINRKKTSIVQIYKRSFSGFAARLSEAEAESMAERPGVVSVFPDSMAKPHTTRSWDFLASLSQTTAFQNPINSTPTNVSGVWSGRDTIIGFIDFGIWPQHPSFNDEHTGSIPQRWKGTCMTPLKCNRKVIGARYYDDPEDPGFITTAMDEDGHGTHVASTAAGIPVNGASYYGLAKGVARGGCPNSRIAMYRVCGIHQCPYSSILKAFDDAIADGVDIISASIGEHHIDLLESAVSIGSFHAMEKGIIVVASAGNEGPSSGTVGNFSPWILTVGATTMDRDFEIDIVLGKRPNKVIKGGGITFLNTSAMYPLIDGRSAEYNKSYITNATRCLPDSLDYAKVKGKIVLCEYDDDIDIDSMIKQGVKCILIISNYLRQGTFSYGLTPIVGVSETDGAQIYSYINSTRNPRARILSTAEVAKNYKPAPVVAVFSSRGPAPGMNNLIIKPDVTAPGVKVLAATCFNDTDSAKPGKEPPLFKFESGTSMACPHVSGLAATVKSWYSTWTPSAIKSAIMTTAITTNNYNAPITTFDDGLRATPYDIGSGEISLFGPLWPGLVYEIETIDYILFLCNYGYNTSVIKLLSSIVPDNFSCPSNSSPDLISDLNYPSIAVSGLIPNVKKTVKRTVTNVGKDCSTFNVFVEAPANVHVQVVPNTLRFTKNVKKLSFVVTFLSTASSSTSKEDTFGSITWYNQFHKVRSPIVVSKA